MPDVADRIEDVLAHVEMGTIRVTSIVALAAEGMLAAAVPTRRAVVLGGGHYTAVTD